MVHLCKSVTDVFYTWINSKARCQINGVRSKNIQKTNDDKNLNYSDIFE